MASVRFIKVDGTEWIQTVHKPLIANISQIISASICDTVNLRDGNVMIVDDGGIEIVKPVNQKATDIFQGIYPRAKSNDRKIYGDVAIAWDEDFA